jgi:APA family basic amino acid/polyamine antiporter
MTTSLKERQTAVLDQSTAEGLNRSIGSGMSVGISSFAAWMLGVGGIIGSMAWLFHGPMLARAGTLPSVVAWILAGIFTIPLAMILMELASMFPTAGGPYVYKYYALKRLIPGMGEMLGFLTGWLFWMCLLGGLACMSNGMANLLSSSIWGSATASPLWFGPVVIFALFAVTTSLNLMHVGNAARLNNLFTLLKFVMALSFGALVLFSHSASLANVIQTSSPSGETDFFKNVASVLMLALAGLAGIELSGCTSSETKDAQKSVPKAMFLTLLTVTLIYVGMCVAVSAAAPYILNSTKTTMIVPGTNFQATCPSMAGFLAGPAWGIGFTACVVASIVGCGFGCLLATARFGYSMAKTGLFPQQFATLDPISRVPKYALLFQFVILCIMGIGANLLARSGVFPDAYTFLAETYGFMYAFVALLYGVSVVSLRYTDPDLPRPFRVGKTGNGLVWVFAIITIAIWGYAAFGCVKWTHQLGGILTLLAGIPIYGFYRWRN